MVSLHGAYVAGLSLCLNLTKKNLLAESLGHHLSFAKIKIAVPYMPDDFCFLFVLVICLHFVHPYLAFLARLRFKSSPNFRRIQIQLMGRY